VGSQEGFSSVSSLNVMSELMQLLEMICRTGLAKGVGWGEREKQKYPSSYKMSRVEEAEIRYNLFSRDWFSLVEQ
jgi:hypothetical protein